MEHENCAGVTNCCRIIGKCKQVTGKVECQNHYLISTEKYTSGNGEDFEKGVGTLAGVRGKL